MRLQLGQLPERIYPGQDQGGIIINTAVPDAGGTLGGLVSLAEPEPLTRIMQRALRGAPLLLGPRCAERLPKAPADFLHGAACHACLLVSGTICKRGNRFLGRRFMGASPSRSTRTSPPATTGHPRR